MDIVITALTAGSLLLAEHYAPWRLRLLQPVFEEVNAVRVNISKARGTIQAEYQAGQAAGWHKQE